MLTYTTIQNITTIILFHITHLFYGIQIVSNLINYLRYLHLYF